jgi:hypothetical protein
MTINKTNYKKSGMMIISVLMLTVLLLILTFSMIQIAATSMNLNLKVDVKAKAMKSAEAGLDYAFYQLNTSPDWGNSITSDILENLGNGQSFTLLFTSTHKGHRSKNNLTNKNPDGTTPRYSVEIISKGTFSKNGNTYNVYLRGIFSREELLPAAVCSEGDIYYDVGQYYQPQNYKIEGKTANDPGVIWSNSNLNIKKSSFPNPSLFFNLNKGYVAAVNNVNIDFSLKKKVQCNSERVPDINVNAITSSAPTGFTTVSDPNANFYLIGYFEHNGPLDAGTDYCIPHGSPTNVSYDPDKKTGVRKFAVAYFNEPNMGNFIDNYFKCMPWDAQRPPGSPPAKYLYDCYPDLTFVENPAGLPLLPVTISDINPDPSDGGSRLKLLTLTNDLFIPSSYPSLTIFRTDMHQPLGALPNVNYVLHNMRITNMKFDLNHKKIFSQPPLSLEVPPYSVDPNSAIVCSDNIEFTHCYPLTTTMVSGKSIRIVNKDFTGQIGPVLDISFTGFMYARNDIAMDTPTGGHYWNQNVTYNFTGRMISKDETPGDFSPPIICLKEGYRDTAQLTSMKFYNNYMYRHGFGSCNESIKIKLSDDGIDTLVNIRGVNFKIRKMFYQVL